MLILTGNEYRCICLRGVGSKREGVVIHYTLYSISTCSKYGKEHASAGGLKYMKVH